MPMGYFTLMGFVMKFSGWVICAALFTGIFMPRASAQSSGIKFSECQGLAELVRLESPWLIGGWTNLAYYTNNIPLSFADDDLGSFDDLPGQVNLAQQWLYLERSTDGQNGFDVGGRIDVLYGTDAQKSQAYGNPNADIRGLGRFDASLDHGVYGWALPQVYGEIAWQDLTTKIGHFQTPLGYEKTQAPGNFFHSHSFTSFDSEPFTHTGFLTTFEGFEKLKLYGGWSAGWDTGFDSLNSGSNFIGGFDFEIVTDLTFTYLNTWGNFGWRDGGGDDSYSHSCVLKAKLTEKLEYIAQSDLLDTDNGAISQYDTIGLVQYAFYKHNDWLGLGGRAEWWKADGVSHYEITGGVNIFLTSCLVVRPEVRRDWIPADDFSQDVFAIDTVWKY
jgi:hypothetical protein